MVESNPNEPPLKDLLVLDFSTLLPGPMATLILRDAGANVIKIERPHVGDEMRTYVPAVDGESINFAILNRGKESLEIDLKKSGAREMLLPLIQRADVIVEQFRPGVMERLGLGYEAVKAIKKDIIYCSITGWGQSGSKATEAGHDLNYLAETGVLGLTIGSDGAPILPPILAADVAGGTYPAVINILLALRRRDRTGEGAWLDVAMGENLFPFLYWALGNANALDQWPVTGGETVTGGSPRYHIYRTRDGRYIAAAPLEDKFWANFVAVLELPPELADDSRNPVASRDAVASRIISKDASEWMEAFAGREVCCSVVLTLEEAVRDPHWTSRGTFDNRLEISSHILPALPSIVVPGLREPTILPSAPVLGASNAVHFKQPV
ncbi:coA-transferase III family protein [Ochrobactrum quorumnocens]|uniref:CoA-transferase III family protein n=1 Tax=Ochrobactrum quorumnocens TaxID=271865 RepID=A0A248UE19_9HYPH|nr:CaiB/BaiF CoA-transferase family protein [[Ochrobactrum] quorumnocens]ASV84862.1 coA-transferase III family protein [[Ochrobactrum] quorumnocens]